MPIKHVIFDLDGTLVDSLPGIWRTAQEAVWAVWPGRALCELRNFIGPPVREVLRRALPGASEAELDALDRHFRSGYDAGGWRHSLAYDGAQRLLERLAELGVGRSVVTNKPILPTRRILEHLGLERLLDEVVSRDSRTPPFTSKAAAMRHLVERCRLNIESTLMVGDSQDDAGAAAECGVRFAWASYGYGRCDEPSAAVKIGCLAEVERLVEDG